MGTRVYLEQGTKKVFACALEWPGWCRGGRTDEAALEALAAYAPRYALVAVEAGIAFPGGAGGASGAGGAGGAGGAFRVVERLPGDATTDFGAPSAVATSDTGPLGAKEAERLAAIVGAAWAVFDAVVADAPAELRKGPRGGGRDRDTMAEHVLGAEAMYARKIGIRQRQPALHDAAAISALRMAILGVVGAPSSGGSPVGKGWPVRYAARRIAWHVLDHAWEMQDRSDPGG